MFSDGKRIEKLGSQVANLTAANANLHRTAEGLARDLKSLAENRNREFKNSAEDLKK